MVAHVRPVFALDLDVLARTLPVVLSLLGWVQGATEGLLDFVAYIEYICCLLEELCLLFR